VVLRQHSQLVVITQLEFLAPTGMCNAFPVGQANSPWISDEGFVAIRVEQLNKRFGEFVAVQNVSFEVPEGELVALLGPSGGGKSTILRIISGLEEPDSGVVSLDGSVVNDLSPRDRRVGFVFQHYALFRHMTVADNIGYGLKVRGASKAERRDRVNELIAIMGLNGLGDRLPSQLSGGQRQRVALARSLAPRPRLLLLDEPFAAVDAKVREELRIWLRKLHDEVGVTSLFVTHDQDEAFALADRVLIINKGGLEQDGTPEEILEEPATEFVARFIGDVNVLDAHIANGIASVGRLRVPVNHGHPDVPSRLVIRSYELKFWCSDAGPAVVRRIIPLGDRVRVEATIDGAGPLIAQFPRRSSLLQGIEPGVRIAVEVTKVRAYAATNGTTRELQYS
jgi:sulfate/thiosulfate transport system ATP-binding protein